MSTEHADGIVFEPQQVEAFKEYFRNASDEYRPDGLSFWRRVTKVDFGLICDTTGMDLPVGYAGPDTGISAVFVKLPDTPGGNLRLNVRGRQPDITQDQLSPLSYNTARPTDRMAVGHILRTVINAEIGDFEKPNTILDRLRGFSNFELRRTQIIQKTFDPAPGAMEKEAVHLSLSRSLIHSPHRPGQGMAVSRLFLGRPVNDGSLFFTYWQMLQSNPDNLAAMYPSANAYYFGAYLPTPSMGRRFESMNPDNIGRLLEINMQGPLAGDYRYDLAAFEERLRLSPNNRHVSIGALTAEDAVRLIAEPLDERLRLRME